MKRLLFGVWFFLSATGIAGGQNPLVVDSLCKLLTTKVGADRYPHLYDLAFEYIDVDNDKALEIIIRAEEAALLSGDSLWIVKSMRVKAQVLSRLERFSDAITWGERARRIANNNGYENEHAMIMNSLAGAYAFNLRYDKSLEYFFGTLHLARSMNDSSLVSTALHNIGVVYARLENYRTSLDYLLKAREVSEAIDERKYYELRSLSISYANLNDFFRAECSLKESLIECGPSCPKVDLMKIRFTEGLISFCKKDYGTARRQLLSVYPVAQEVGNVQFQLDIIHLLTEMSLMRHEIYEAKRLLADAERLIANGSELNLEKLRIFRMLSFVNLSAKDYRAGAFYQGKYISLKDSLYNNGLMTRLMEIESEFKQTENRALIARQTEMIQLKEAVIIRQRQLNVATGLLVLISVGFLFFVFRNYRKKKKLNIILDERVTERTYQLEASRNSLLCEIRQRDLVIHRVSSGFKEQISTLRALHSAAAEELSDSLALQYIEKYDEAASRMERFLFVLSLSTLRTNIDSQC